MVSIINKLNFLLDLFLLFVAEFLEFIKCNKENLNIMKSFKLENKKTTKRLLIVSLTDNYFIFSIESLFAKYFNLAGYQVYFLTNPRNRNATRTFLGVGGNMIYHINLYLKNFAKVFFTTVAFPKNGEELKHFTYHGVNLGIGVYALVCRRFKVGLLDLSDRKIRKDVEKFLSRSIVYLESAREMITKIKPDLIITNEKGYASTSEIFGLAVKEGVDFIQWVGCPEPNALVFKRYKKNNTKDHPHSISETTWNKSIRESWDEHIRMDVDKIFEDGYIGGKWFNYNRLENKTARITREELVKKYGLDPNKKIAVLFAHVMWDANLFYGSDLFEKGFEEWYIESIKAMAQNDNVNWLIKIHPANRFKHKMENIKVVYREISAVEETFGFLPKNIKFIYPEDEINPYSLFQFIDYGITVRGTVGSELPCFGVPVLTAGTGRYSGKGFTNDSKTKEEYLNKLTHIETIAPLSERERQLAYMHAYLFFKVRPLPFSSFKEIWRGKQQDAELMIQDVGEGDDFKKFVNWADKSVEEDFLNRI